MEIKVGDIVKLKNRVIAKIININDFREPSMRYGADIEGYWDVVFFGDDDIVEKEMLKE